MRIWKQAEIWQFAKSLLCEFDIANNEQIVHESCLNFTSMINKEKKNDIDNIAAYEQLKKAEKKIAEGVNLPEAYSERAKARAALKEYDLAVKDYLYSIFLNPNDISTYNWLIQHVGINTDNYNKELMETAGEMCRRFPDSPKSYGCRGFVKSKNGDLEGAVADCNKALAMEENRWHYNVRGNCWLKMGKKQPDRKEQFEFRALIDFWCSQHISPGYGIARNYIKNTVKTLTPKRIRKELEKARETGYEKTIQIYQECLEIAGVKEL